MTPFKDQYVAQTDNTRVDRTNIQYQEQPDKKWVQQGDFLVNTKTGERKINALPLERVYPEFDVLTLIRSLTNLPKGFTKGLNPNDESLYYRQLDKGSKGLERAKDVGVIDTKSSGGINFTTSKGKTLRLGKTFDTPFFNKGGFWYNNVKDMDVIVGKDNPLLDWKMITQHGRVTEDAVRAAGRRTPFYNGATNQAPTKLFELYRHYPIIGYRNVTNGFPTLPVTGLNTLYNLSE